MDAIAVKTSQDALLTGVGLFLPTDANEVEFNFEIFKGMIRINYDAYC